MLDLCLESIIFLKKIKHKIIISSNIIDPSPKKSVAPSEKVAPGQEVEKGSRNVYDIEEPVVTICQKDLDNKIEKDNINKYQFQGQYARSKLWFGIDYEWLEENFPRINPVYINSFIKLILKVKIWKHIKYF